MVGSRRETTWHRLDNEQPRFVCHATCFFRDSELGLNTQLLMADVSRHSLPPGRSGGSEGLDKCLPQDGGSGIRCE